MRKNAFLYFLFLIIMTSLGSPAGPRAPAGAGAVGEEERGRIEQSIRASIGWAKNKDLKLLHETIANDSDFLEVHPDGRVVRGFEEFKKAESIWMSPDFKAVRYEIRDLRIKLSRSGDVAWFFCILDDINEWKGQPASWENARWTGVLEKRDERWVMVQQHFSLPKERPANGGRLEAKAPLSLIYVANMGVLVGSGGTKVLIDALFDRPNPEYRAPAPEILDKIMSDAPPFDGVDLVLVTHNHPDHFNAALAVRYLEGRPGPVLLAPSDAVEEMRKAATDWSKIGPRVVSIGLKVREMEARTVKGISVTALRTLHNGGGETPMNLMYLIDLHGRRVFHEGDSAGKPEVFQGFGLESAPVDLAVVHFWFPLDPDMAKYLQEVLSPEHIALGHLPVRLESDAPAKIDMVRHFYKDIALLLPSLPAKIIQMK